MNRTPSEQQGERKLGAILAADIVGFSRLAGADEDRTLARLRTLRSDLIDPTIAVHRGRVVKRTGDGLIIEFRSVVDAVRCAIECLNGMIERNAGVPPDRRIEFRVGIHLGDVVEEADGDLMGDGVNIAARLEGIAKPGAIYLSEDAYRQVKSRLDVALSDVGATQLKNIAEPVRVYSVQVGKPSLAKTGRANRPANIAAVAAGAMALAVIGFGGWYLAKDGRPVAQAPARIAASRGPTVAVLPFVNETGDASDDALATRIAEDMIGYLGNFSWLRIVGRSAGSTKSGGDPIDAARQSGADYVVTGALRSGATALRVSLQVDEARSGARIWSKTLEPTAEAVRTGSGEAEVAGRAGALIGEPAYGAISDAEFKRTQSKPDNELSSYECVVLGNYSDIPAVTARARGCLEATVAREPANANAWSALSVVLTIQIAIMHLT